VDAPPELDAYLDLSGEDIARLILMLMIEEALRQRLAEFREESRPVEICELSVHHG
jgi:hypothetical protein